MTVGEAMERAEELRPGSRLAARTRQRWLCEVDGMLRDIRWYVIPEECVW